MVNSEGYNYDQFVDSSDEVLEVDNKDNLSYNKGIMNKDNSTQCSPSKTNENIMEGNKEETSHKSSCVAHKGATIPSTENLQIALINVVEMAKEQIDNYPNNFVDSERIIAEQSIKMVQDYIRTIVDSNAILAKEDKQ